MLRLLRAFIVALALVPAAARCQSASATARAFFQAHTDHQWQAMADFVDSASLRAMREVADKMVASFATMAKPEVRAAMDSAGVGAMANMMSSLQSMMGPGSMLRFMFAHVTDAAELQAMPDRDLMARWFEAKSPGYTMGLASNDMLKGMIDRMPAAEGSGMRAAMDVAGATPLPWEVVGEIPEGRGVSHVVYRVAGQTPQGATGILTFRATGGRWYIHFTNPDDQLGHMAALALSAMQAAQR